MRVGFRHLFGAALFAACFVGLASACGIDFPGSADLDASDELMGEGGLPVGCATLATPCLGALPEMWKPITVAAPQCATGFTAATLVVNPQVGSGACACGACQPVGSFTCNGKVTVSGGDNCNDPAFDMLTSGTCTKAIAQHIRGLAPQATGTVGCFAPNDAGKGATTEALGVCVPSCSADFCASSSRCIVADGEKTCPPSFQLRAHAGLAVDPGCPPCQCEAGAPGKCTGTVTAYESMDCTKVGSVKQYALDTCNTFDKPDYGSLLAKLVPPDASCAPIPTSPIAHPSLVGAKTICCQ